MNNLLDAIIAAKLAGGGGGGSGLTEDVKQALLACFANVAWATEDGQQYYDALEAALYPLDRITAVYTQSGTVYDTDSLDSLRADLVVTAFYQGGDSKTVTTYTLSGTLTVGTSTITVSYGGKTATFEVVVSYIDPAYQQVEWIGATGTQYIDTGIIPTNYRTIEVEYESQKAVGETAQDVFGTLKTSGSNSAYNFRCAIYSANTTVNIAITGRDGDPTNNSLSCSLTMPNDNYVNAKRKYYVNERDGVFSVGEISDSLRGSVDVHESYYPLFVLARNANNVATNFSKGKLYSAIYSDESGQAFNLIPCYRKSDNVIGVFDKISKTFLTNAGTGTFTKGIDVSG